jgi:tetratricopeptide (TPR) repeat protein
MGENLLLMLLGLLIQKDDLQQIREIEYNLDPKEINNPDLLIMFALINAMNYNFQLAVKHLNRALKKEEVPQNIEALMHLMLTIYEAEKYELMFKVWIDNFKTLNQLIDQHGLEKIPLVSTLRFLLINSFGFESDKEFDSKNEIKKLADIFLQLNQNIEAIDDHLDQNEVDEILTEIDSVLDEIAYDSVLYLMLLERLIGVEYYLAAKKYYEKAADYNKQNSEFLLLRARYNYYQNNLEQAKEDIEQSLEHYHDKSGFEKDNLFVDKLLILTARKEFNEVVEVLKDMKAEAEMPLVTAVAKGLVPHPIRSNVKLFNSLIKLKEPDLFEQKKLYTAALYNIFIKRDMLSLELDEIRDDFEEVLSYMPDNTDSQLAQMAGIYLKSNKLSEAESLKELEKINQKPAEFTDEAEIKFEYNLKLKNNDYLLKEKYFAEEKELLQDGDFAFYKMIALLNAEGVDKALSYLKKLSPEEGIKIFQRMMQEGDSFLREEELLEEIEEEIYFD